MSPRTDRTSRSLGWTSSGERRTSRRSSGCPGLRTESRTPTPKRSRRLVQHRVGLGQAEGLHDCLGLSGLEDACTTRILVPLVLNAIEDVFEVPAREPNLFVPTWEAEHANSVVLSDFGTSVALHPERQACRADSRRGHRAPPARPSFEDTGEPTLPGSRCPVGLRRLWSGLGCAAEQRDEEQKRGEEPQISSSSRPRRKSRAVTITWTSSGPSAMRAARALRYQRPKGRSSL